MAVAGCSYVGLVSDKPLGRDEIAGYLVEAYVPRRRTTDVVALASAAESGAEQARRAGKTVRYVRSILVPHDETCFHVYEAAFAAEVQDAAQRAGITGARIVYVLQIEPAGDPIPASAQRKETRT